MIADGTRDTIIQITNTSNSVVYAHCFYVNGALTFPDHRPGPTNPPLWTEVDFDIILTKQQPTHWVVSRGRAFNPLAPICTNLPGLGGPNYDCNDAGLFGGRVPPVVEYFTGELKCIEVDASGMPLSGNHLKGEATIVTRNNCELDGGSTGECILTEEPCGIGSGDPTCTDTYDVAKHNAIGLRGNENNDGDGILCLGGEPNDSCPLGAEYDACPNFWIANHFADDAPDPVIDFDDDTEVETVWTIVPCTQNFETQVPETVTIFIETWNEFEQAFSSFVTVTCWGEFELDDINPVTFDYGALGSTFAQSRLRRTSQTPSSFVMVGTEIHEDEGRRAATADVNYHVEGVNAGGDIWTIPADQLQ
ncbi:MAG: hypothetical protein AB7V27_06740 [Candidatus Binatia bacterium]